MPEASCPLARRFLALAARRPDAAALLGPDGGTLATRRDLVAAAGSLAASFAPSLTAGEPVVLAAPNSLEQVAAFLALRLAGRPVALVDAASPTEELERCARTVGASAVVTVAERLPAERCSWRGHRLALARLDAVAPVALPAHTAVLKLTSGSTGSPRAVAVSARQLAADSVQIMRTMRIRPDDRTLAAIPLSHSYGLGSCLVPLLLAGTPLLFPTCALPAALAEALAAGEIAHFPAVPAMIRALAKLPEPPRLSALRVCLAAGAPLAPRDAEAFLAAFGTKVHVFYGSSECGGISYDRSDDGVHESGAVGAAMERVVLEVIDAAGTPLPPGEEGRVRVRSRAVALALLPQEQDERTVTPECFLTGDLGRLDADGGLRLTGRVSDLLNVAGKKVHPDEVRRVLEAVPGVVSAVVLGLPDRHRGELVAAVVAVDPAAGVTVQRLLRSCRARLAPHKAPRRLVLVDELPVSERGKVQREALLELLRRADTG